MRHSNSWGDNGETPVAVAPAADIHARDHPSVKMDMIQLSHRTVTVTNVEERAVPLSSKSAHPPRHIVQSSASSPSRRRAVIMSSSSRGSKLATTPESNRRSTIVQRACAGNPIGLTEPPTEYSVDFSDLPDLSVIKRESCDPSTSASTSMTSLPSQKDTSTFSSSEDVVLTVYSLAIQESDDLTSSGFAVESAHPESPSPSLPPQTRHAQVQARPPSSNMGVLANTSPVSDDPPIPTQKRLSHRLSYLTHVEQFGEADDNEDDEDNGALEIERIEITGGLRHSQDLHLGLTRSAPRSTYAVSTLTKCNENEMATVASRHHQSGLPSVSTPPRLPPTSGIHSTSTTPGGQSQNQPLPKLYRRLLRLFKPPSDSSDSGDVASSSPPSSTAWITARGQSRGPFGFPANPFGENRPFSASRRTSSSSVDTSASRAAATTPSTASKRCSHVGQQVVEAVKMSSPLSPTPQKRRVRETLGLRARLMRKLASSPNLKTETDSSCRTVAAPDAGCGTDSTFSHQQDAIHVRSDGSCSDHADQLHLDLRSAAAAKDAEILLYSQTPFHHDVSCPAGQRRQARAEVRRHHGQARPRANTLPRIPEPTPTLQSKYGTPGRELGAGTQAQVMLLRVPSEKRIRDCFGTQSPFFPTAEPASLKMTQSKSKSESTQFPKLSSTIASASPTASTVVPSKMEPGMLKPLEPSGTITTTTSEYMTPEQREAYRKRLSSNYGGSVPIPNRDGLNSPLRSRHDRTEDCQQQNDMQPKRTGELVFAIKRFRPPKANESHRQYLKKICAEFCISTSMVHENVIRTIDLVRNQPGQDIDGEGHNWDEQHRQHSLPQTFGAANRSESQEIEDLEDENDVGDESECDDCQCPNFDIYRHHRQHQQALTKRRSGVVVKQRRKSSSGTLPARRPSPSSFSQLQQKMEEEQHQQEVRRLKQEQQRQQHQNLSVFKKKMVSEDGCRDHFPEYCMVMEFAAGGDMFTLLTKSIALTLNEKHCLWRQLVNGVHYLHSMGVAHRDLKPENLLIDESGRILKITDFGIASVFKSVGEPAALPCRGILGSEPYIAPEEFYQEEYDPRMVDVWACGIIFYVLYYLAMPWARADRKKDARFARYVSDIFTYRRSEPLRRQQYERYMAAQLAYTATTRERQQQQQLLGTGARDTLRRGKLSAAPACGDSLPSTFLRGERGNLQPLFSMEDTSPVYIYNTYAYSRFLGGHEFIDRIEAPGCRRVLYAILEPDVRRRLTIEQVLQDEWVQQIRYCTNEPEKQEQQCLMHHSLTGDAEDMERIKEQGRLSDTYMRMPQGRLHHQHAVPKCVKV
ncbi:serine/threonine-protein kinase HAL4/sat4 [Actinomortierella ambigua]|uniref:non-specific serine/threonine protein kinase n=1 Tax=Actinomortierella ambigua TaxID=1343610 RepID=A0A9P6U4P4_9FUNG|nr:serine/threonine-protein kinase HAL4/sat4 [Actinomortierella ambigua]